jgi:hypothetical protein
VFAIKYHKNLKKPVIIGGIYKDKIILKNVGTHEIIDKGFVN